MEPTLHDNDSIIEMKAKYSTIRKGDLVTIKKVIDGEESYIVKRVVGMPNDQIDINGSKVKVNWIEVEESYAYYSKDTKDEVSILLGPDEYFCMGDNRVQSLDSREVGPIKEYEIVGKVVKIKE